MSFFTKKHSHPPPQKKIKWTAPNNFGDTFLVFVYIAECPFVDLRYRCKKGSRFFFTCMRNLAKTRPACNTPSNKAAIHNLLRLIEKGTSFSCFVNKETLYYIHVLFKGAISEFAKSLP